MSGREMPPRAATATKAPLTTRQRLTIAVLLVLLAVGLAAEFAFVIRCCGCLSWRLPW